MLVQQPANYFEPVVAGVLDGFTKRQEFQYRPSPCVVLKKDGSVRIDRPDGQALIEIYQDENGPVVRLLDDNMNVDLKGRLRISALSIELAPPQKGM